MAKGRRRTQTLNNSQTKLCTHTFPRLQLGPRLSRTESKTTALYKHEHLMLRATQDHSIGLQAPITILRNQNRPPAAAKAFGRDQYRTRKDNDADNKGRKCQKTK